MKLLKPAELLARFKAGESREQIFLAPGGGYQAKLAGPEATVAVVGENTRTLEFTISTESIDRYGDTIKLGGWQLANYQRNPVVLWAHDDYTPPIGRAANVRTDNGALCSQVEFAPRDIYPLADTVFQLLKGKFLNAASVGFAPLKYAFVEDRERFGIDFLEQELLEWSVVSIPANPDCLVGARALGIDTAPLIGWAERLLDRARLATGDVRDDRADEAGMSLAHRAELELLRKAAGAASVYPVRAHVLPAKDVTKAFDENVAAVKTLCRNGEINIDELATCLIALARKEAAAQRAGKVLSAENEKKLRAAYDHAKSAGDRCAAACDHLDDVLKQANSDDVDPDDDEREDAAPAAVERAIDPDRARRERRIRALKLAASSTTVDAQILYGFALAASANNEQASA